MTEVPERQSIYTAESSIHGTGLFAGAEISEGAYIGTYDGHPTKRNGTYVLWVQIGDEEEWRGIDGNNELRYLNHSATPNAEFDGTALFALRDIQEGEEVTIDYGEWFETDDS